MPSLSRRAFLERLAALSTLPLLPACLDEPAPQRSERTPTVEATACPGYGALTEAELNARQGLGYVDLSKVPEQYCSTCANFVPDAFDASPCAGCEAFAGPVAPTGWCRSWAPVS